MSCGKLIARLQISERRNPLYRAAREAFDVTGLLGILLTGE